VCQKEGELGAERELALHDIAEGLAVLLLEALSDLAESLRGGRAEDADEDVLVRAGTLGSCPELIRCLHWININSIITLHPGLEKAAPVVVGNVSLDGCEHVAVEHFLIYLVN